jgi:hypothetical protein
MARSVNQKPETKNVSREWPNGSLDEARGSGQAPAIDESKCFIIFRLREGMGIRVAVVLLSPANPRPQTEPPRAREAMPPHEATRAADLTSRPGTTSICSTASAAGT